MYYMNLFKIILKLIIIFKIYVKKFKLLNLIVQIYIIINSSYVEEIDYCVLILFMIRFILLMWLYLHHLFFFINIITNINKEK